MLPLNHTCVACHRGTVCMWPATGEWGDTWRTLQTSVPKAQVLSENSPVPPVLYLWAMLCVFPFQTRSFIVKHSNPRGALG